MNASSKIRSHSTTGADGSIFVNTATAVEGNFYAVQIVAANSKLTLVGNLDNASGIANVALPSGFTVYGRFDSVAVTTGSAILHKV
jgi:hypothetical protein